MACGEDRGRHIEERIYRMYMRTRGREKDKSCVSAQPGRLKGLSQTSFSNILTLPKSNICKIKASATVFPGSHGVIRCPATVHHGLTELLAYDLLCFTMASLLPSTTDSGQGSSSVERSGRKELRLKKGFKNHLSLQQLGSQVCPQRPCVRSLVLSEHAGKGKTL